MYNLVISILDAILFVIYLGLAIANPHQANAIVYGLCALCWITCCILNFKIWKRNKELDKKREETEKYLTEVREQFDNRII